jgi:uncharacterized protein (TIGR03437 family)
MALVLAGAAWGQTQLTLDPAGNVWKTGRVANAFTCGVFKVPPGISENIPCGDATVTELDPSGTRVLFTATIGGHGDSGGVAIAADPAGNVYIAGYTTSPDFPVTSDALQTHNAGPYTSMGASNISDVYPGGDTFVVKLNPDGSVAYSTFLGGAGNDVPTAISVDGSGAVYVAGSTTSTDFPLTASPVSTMPSGGYFGKISPDGHTLNYSTYFPASIGAVATDPAGAAYLAGDAGNTLPTTPGSLQPTSGVGFTNAFVAKISTTGSSLVYSTYLGASDSAYAIAVDSQGAAWVGGGGGPTNFPGITGSGSAFLIKLAPDGSVIETGIRFGPSIPGGSGATFYVAVDAQDNVYASGFLSQITGPFPATAFQPTPNAQLSRACDSAPGFLLEQASNGTPLYASYLRQSGTMFVTAPGHLLFYNNAVSTVDLTSTPAMNFSCPANSASYAVALAPGEIVSLFGYGIGPDTGVGGEPDANGRFPTLLAGVQVLFNGVPAPLLYVQAAVINTVVPQSVNGATIQISYQGRSAPALEVLGQSANPGVFVVANQDGTVNSQSNPAKSGSTITLYATGMEITGVNLTDGQVAPISPLIPFNFGQNGDAVLFSGIAGSIQWEGAAPELIFGTDQINVQLPSSLAVTPPFSSVAMVVQSAYLYSSPPFAVFIAP